MSKKRIILFAASVLMLVGCKKVAVDFTYSPAEPKAGETVLFTNNSTGGESWTWNFGDNATSLTKNPNKVYKKPGTYVVTLMVDSAKNQTCSKVISIYDTIPTFVCSVDTLWHYQDVTFTANVYNPYGYDQTFDWVLPDTSKCIIQSGSTKDAAVSVYFTQPGQYDIQLTIKQKDKVYPTIKKTFVVNETKDTALVMRTTDGTILRQRMIGDSPEEERLEKPNVSKIPEDEKLILAVCDTMVEFNGITYYASRMQALFPNLEVKRMQMDHVRQIWYIVTDKGLYAASINGKYLRLIDSQATGALYVDKERQRLYWATANGLFAVRLQPSVTNNNAISDTPSQYNELTNIDLITVNNNPQ